MVDFDRLNRETQAYRNRQVDRFNPSTKANYSGFNSDKLNNRTFYENNSQYSNYYNYR